MDSGFLSLLREQPTAGPGSLRSELDDYERRCRGEDEDEE